MDADKALKFAESIPMDELYDEIRRVTGLSDLKFTTKITVGRYDEPYIAFKSQDLAERTGFLKILFSTLVITEFNSQVKYNEDKDAFWYWGSVTFEYTHPNGGSNGHTFLNYRYDNGRWDFD